jgi:predicted transcriptional regulator of viral defense system
MRYNNRITLIRKVPPADPLHDRPTETRETVTCMTIPITSAQELSVYGLANTMAYEVHVKNPVKPVNEIELDGVKWTINKTFVNRKSTVFIVSGGAANG